MNHAALFFCLASVLMGAIATATMLFPMEKEEENMRNRIFRISISFGFAMFFAAAHLIARDVYVFMENTWRVLSHLN